MQGFDPNLTVNSIPERDKNPGERELIDLFSPFNAGGGVATAFITGQKYFLEIQDYLGKSKMFMPFPYDPSGLQFSRPTSAKFTHTVSGNFIREFTQTRHMEIVIQGKSGIAPRLFVSRDGGLLYDDGEAAFLELDEFLKNYQYRNSTKHLKTDMTFIRYKSGSKKSYEGGVDMGDRMVLHCLNEQISIYVEPINFSFVRDASSRNSYNYTLSLKGYKYVEKTTEEIFTIFEGFTTSVNRLQRLASAGSTIFETAGNFMDGVNDNFVLPIKGIFRNAQRAIVSLEDAVFSTTALVGSVISLASEVANVVNQAVRSYNRVVSPALLDSINRSIDGVVNDWGRINDKDDLVGVSEQIRDARLASMLDNRQELVSRSSALTAVENIQQKFPDIFADLFASSTESGFLNSSTTGLSITDNPDFFEAFYALASARYEVELSKSAIPRNFDNGSTRADYYVGYYLANESSLKEISSAGSNNLYNASADNTEPSEPYTVIRLIENQNLIDVALVFYGDADRWVDLKDLNGWKDMYLNGEGRPCQGGDSIKIPLRNTLLVEINPFLEVQTPEDLLGRDLSMPLNDLVFEGNDLALSSGADNLAQVVRHRLLTVKGEIPGFESYGLSNFIGDAINGSKTPVDYLTLSIRRELLGDPRVASVSNVEILIDGDKVDFSCNIIPVAGSILKTRIPLN